MILPQRSQQWFDRYSVPPSLVGRTLTLAADDRAVRILDGDAEVAHHARSLGRKQIVEDPAHRAEGRAFIDQLAQDADLKPARAEVAAHGIAPCPLLDPAPAS